MTTETKQSKSAVRKRATPKRSVSRKPAPPSGLHAYRLKQSFRVREREFAEAWAKQGNTLAYLLGNGRDPVTPTEREQVIAATLMQWLGSNVGQAFLSDLGYRKQGGESGRF